MQPTSVRQAIKMLTSGLRPRPRCGKKNRAARLRCKRPKGHEDACLDGCVEFDDDTAWFAPGPTDPGGDVRLVAGRRGSAGQTDRGPLDDAHGPRGRVRRKQGPGRRGPDDADRGGAEARHPDARFARAPPRPEVPTEWPGGGQALQACNLPTPPLGALFGHFLPVFSAHKLLYRLLDPSYEREIHIARPPVGYSVTVFLELDCR